MLEREKVVKILQKLYLFFFQISILQELRHPHVAMLLGVCSRREKWPLIVMEYLACGSLHTWLHGPGRWVGFGSRTKWSQRSQIHLEFTRT